MGRGDFAYAELYVCLAGGFRESRRPGSWKQNRGCLAPSGISLRQSEKCLIQCLAHHNYSINDGPGCHGSTRQSDVCSPRILNCSNVCISCECSFLQLHLTCHHRDPRCSCCVISSVLSTFLAIFPSLFWLLSKKLIFLYITKALFSALELTDDKVPGATAPLALFWLYLSLSRFPEVTDSFTIYKWLLGTYHSDMVCTSRMTRWLYHNPPKAITLTQHLCRCTNVILKSFRLVETRSLISHYQNIPLIFSLTLLVDSIPFR